LAFSDHAGSGMIGKSHLVQAIGLEALKAGFVVLYRSIFDLVRELLAQETQAIVS
jgi:DNA replication protein DnaC